MDKNGELLESGTYENNYYGTPKPPTDPSSQLVYSAYSRSSANFGYSPRDPLPPPEQPIVPSVSEPSHNNHNYYYIIVIISLHV